MKITENMKSGHFLKGFHVNQATPLLMFVVFAWVLKAIHLLVPEDTLARLGFSLSNGELSVDEDLPNFYEVLKLFHADQIICEYANIKERYGIEIEDAEVIAKLHKTEI